MTSIDPDSIIDGRYRLISRIGSGGMADVYLAEDLQLGRRVALKLLHERFAKDEEFVERFRREASSAAGLQHQNVVQVFDRGEFDGTYYIAMEYLPGRSLKQLVREEGPLDPDRAIDIIVQVLRAARFAHRRGVIHRDIKPHNVIVDDEGRAKVTDFGIARAGASDMTETGSILGTAQYLSPEQAQGHAVDEQSDLYSIGVVLYELLTARVPFSGESAVAIALKHVSEVPVSPRHFNPQVSSELEAVVLRSLAKDPADRFRNADEFIAALEAARGLRADPLLPPAVIDPNGRDENDQPGARWWIALLVLLALLAGGIAAYLLLRADKVTVPNVVGRTAANATQTLRRDGFGINIQQVTSPNVPQDRVISQSPPANQKANKGSTVTLVVSSGPSLAPIPFVAGMSQKNAVALLKRAGFKVDVEHQQSDTVPKGSAIETQPQARSQLPLGSTVTLLISSGPAQVTLPNVVSLPLTEAQNELTGLGLKTVIKQQPSTTGPAGAVLAQSPTAGTKVPKGSTVTLTVSQTPTTASVPNVVSDSVDTAVNTLSNAGFKVQTVTKIVQNPAKNGTVVSQVPAPNTQAKSGSTVTITVGRTPATTSSTAPPSP